MRRVAVGVSSATLILAGLPALAATNPTRAASPAAAVVLAFTACDAKRCEYHELEVPSLSQCQAFAQIAVLDWMAKNNRQGWRLENGWKCHLGHSPGEDIPV